MTTGWLELPTTLIPEPPERPLTDERPLTEANPH
jgi:hypothetical protein